MNIELRMKNKENVHVSMYVSKQTAKDARGLRRGFTLVELLVAISILSISILASFTAVSHNLNISNVAQDQMVAYYLADEGIEAVRNLRDKNSIANIGAVPTGGSVGWMTGIALVASDPCYNKTCTIDAPNANTLTACSGTCPNLKVSDTGLYCYTSTCPNPTGFVRTISVNVISATEAMVTCTVTWTTNNIPQTYTLSEDLRAWQ